jgi:hypothetical protein
VKIALLSGCLYLPQREKKNLRKGERGSCSYGAVKIFLNSLPFSLCLNYFMLRARDQCQVSTAPICLHKKVFNLKNDPNDRDINCVQELLHSYEEIPADSLSTPNDLSVLLFHVLHCKKELAIFPSPAGMSLTKLSRGGKKLNYSRPGRV